MGYKAALRDPCVELDVSGKLLTDDGLQEVTQALKLSLAYDGEHGKIIKLEELCLRGNQLTAKSLLSLGELITQAVADLKDLDLSENTITISTQEDTDAWEYFLRSFSRCHVLRRIDLSKNDLGTKAFEVFARVYSQEELLDLEVSDLSDQDLASYAGSLPALNLRDYSITRGLRSVPYIVFCDTAMTDTCALHLSYVLANHHLPARLLPLVPPAKAGPSAQQIDAYNTTSRCQGIIYLPNDRLSAAAIKVLELSELARTRLVEDGSREDGMTEAETASSTPRRASETPVSPHSSGGGHRRRTISMGGAELEGSRYGSTDLDRARSRVQGDTLRDAGPCSNDLWRASLKFLSLARVLLVRGAQNPVMSQQNTQTAENRSSLGQRSHQLGAFATKSSAMTPLAPRTTNQTLKIRPPSRRKEPILPGKLPMASRATPNPRIAKILSLLRDPNQPYRGPYVGQLHEAQWAHIIALAAGAVGVVSSKQQNAILTRAVDRGSLGKEREILGKSDSAQIWKALEGMGCLAYEGR